MMRFFIETEDSQIFEVRAWVDLDDLSYEDNMEQAWLLEGSRYDNIDHWIKEKNEYIVDPGNLGLGFKSIDDEFIPYPGTRKVWVEE